MATVISTSLTPGEQAFASWILPDFISGMDHIYRNIMIKAEYKSMTNKNVENALRVGYGDDVADGWNDWVSEDD